MDSSRHRLPDTIETARLSLTTPVMDHVPAMAVLANNRAIYDVLARLPHPYDESHGVDFVTQIARGPGEHAWSILMDGVYVGVIGLHFVDGLPPDLGYWLGEPFWGQGIATEAAIAVVAAAREAGYAGLEARALTSNAGSRNVLRKAGFVEVSEGPAPDGTNAGKPTTFLQQEFR